MKCPECDALMPGNFCSCGYKMFPDAKTEGVKKTGAHKDYVPAGEKSTSGIVNEYIGNLKKKTSGGRRNVFLPGESWLDYQAAKHKAKQAGTSVDAFDKSRMALNGYTG